jgi:hypothetical protein
MSKAPDRGLGCNGWFVGFFRRYGGVSVVMTDVLSPPDCDAETFVDSGAFGCRRPTQFVITAGKAKPCNTPQIASNTRHSTVVGLTRFSGHRSLASVRVMKNHEQATIYRDIPNPWAPNESVEATMAVNQAKTIETQTINDWPFGSESRSIVGV